MTVLAFWNIGSTSFNEPWWWYVMNEQVRVTVWYPGVYKSTAKRPHPYDAFLSTWQASSQDIGDHERFAIRGPIPFDELYPCIEQHLGKLGTSSLLLPYCLSQPTHRDRYVAGDIWVEDHKTCSHTFTVTSTPPSRRGVGDDISFTLNFPALNPSYTTMMIVVHREDTGTGLYMDRVPQPPPRPNALTNPNQTKQEYTQAFGEYLEALALRLAILRSLIYRLAEEPVSRQAVGEIDPVQKECGERAPPETQHHDKGRESPQRPQDGAPREAWFESKYQCDSRGLWQEQQGMHLTIFLNTTIEDFEAWVHWRTESDRNPHYDASRDFLWFHPAEIRQRAADKVIMELHASVDTLSPVTSARRRIQVREPIVFQVTRSAPGRIKVEAFAYPPDALPYFFELLADIAQKWPETNTVIARFLEAPTAHHDYDAREPWEKIPGGRGQQQTIARLWYEGKLRPEIATELTLSESRVKNVLTDLRNEDPELMNRIDDEHFRNRRARR